jgi:hypothetical protein
MRKYILAAVIASLSVLVWWILQKSDPRAQRENTPNSLLLKKGAIIERSGRGALPVVARFEDGSVLPLAGAFPPFESRRDDDFFFVEDAEFIVEVCKYDLRGFIKWHETRLEERRSAFGKDAMFPGVRGLSNQGNEVEVLMVTSVKVGGQTWKISGYLEAFDCVRIVNKSTGVSP